MYVKAHLLNTNKQYLGGKIISRCTCKTPEVEGLSVSINRVITKTALPYLRVSSSSPSNAALPTVSTTRISLMRLVLFSKSLHLPLPAASETNRGEGPLMKPHQHPLLHAPSLTHTSTTHNASLLHIDSHSGRWQSVGCASHTNTPRLRVVKRLRT